MIGKVFGLFAYVGAVSVGLFVTCSISVVVYTAGYFDGMNGCDSAALKR